jgi:hypothetical protein
MSDKNMRVKILKLTTCRSCPNFRPEYDHHVCIHTGYEIDTEPDENKQAWYPIPNNCPLEDCSS